MRSTSCFVAQIVLCCVPGAGWAQAQIRVNSARMGCLDIQKDPNLTGLVGSVCKRKFSCSYKAPTEKEYRAAGVQARTRTFCTQGTEISYNAATAGSSWCAWPGRG
jgi:hypothetical protein